MTDYTKHPRGVQRFNPKIGDKFRCLWTSGPDWWTVRRVYTWSGEKGLTCDDGEYGLNGSCSVWDRVTTSFDPYTNRVRTDLLTAEELAALKATGGPWEFWGGGTWGKVPAPGWISFDTYRAVLKPIPTPDEIRKAAQTLLDAGVISDALAKIARGEDA